MILVFLWVSNGGKLSRLVIVLFSERGYSDHIMNVHDASIDKEWYDPARKAGIVSGVNR